MMRTIKQIHFPLFALLYAGVMVLASCANEQDPFASSGQKTEDGKGTLEISLEGPAATRATTPVSAEEAGKYLITILKGTNDTIQKPKPLNEFPSSGITLSAGYGYSLMAESCSEYDAEMAEEAGDENHIKWGKKRFVGKSQSFAIIAGERTSVSVTCKVANGGISAYFDPTVTGTYNITITDEKKGTIVFDASNSDHKNGNKIEKGKTAYFNIPETGKRTVHYSVTIGNVTKEFDQELEVAKFKRLTVSYNSGTFSVGIKVDDEELYMEDDVTVKPDDSIKDYVPEVTTQNVYVDGELVGTTLSATDPSYYRDDAGATEWSAVVKNASGETVRTLSSAKGTLTSGANDANWPYLPMGNYVLEYTFENFKGIVETKQTTFNITEQPDFQVSLNALTSYSYAIGDGTTKDVDQANACANNKIYAPTVTVSGISDALITKYGLSITYSNETKNNTKQAVYSDLTKDPGAYTLNATATFAGYEKNASKTVYITGIPYTAAPPTRDNGWTNPKGTVWWQSSYVQLGNGAEASEQRVSKSFYVPGNVNVSAYVNADTQGALSPYGNTFSFDIAGETKISKYVSGTGSATIKETVNGTLTTGNSTIECASSYGLGATHSRVYEVTVNYR